MILTEEQLAKHRAIKAKADAKRAQQKEAELIEFLNNVKDEDFVNYGTTEDFLAHIDGLIAAKKAEKGTP